MTAVKIGGLFEGYGGLTMAAAEVFGGDLAWYSEIDPGALKILTHHHPDVPNLGDVSTVDWSTVEPVDVLCGGFPCQDVSHAGKRAGVRHGTRSGLWHAMARAIDELRPPLVIIENVRGLLTARGDEPTDAHLRAEATAHAARNLTQWIETRHRIAVQKGRTDDARQLAARRGRAVGSHRRAVARARRHERQLVRALGTVLGSLADLGYDAAWHGLRAADVGAPHGRFRIFIVAWDTRTTDTVGRRLDRRPAQRPRAPGDASRHDPRALLRTPTAQLAVNGGSQHPDKRKAGGHGPTLADEVEHLLPTPNPFHAGNTETPDDWRRRRLDVFQRTGTRHGPALSVVALSVAEGHPLTPDAYMPDEDGDTPCPPPTSPTPVVPPGSDAGSAASSPTTSSRCTSRPGSVSTGGSPDGSSSRHSTDPSPPTEPDALLPTPRATRGGSHTETVAMLPTPTARDHRTGYAPGDAAPGRRGSAPLNDVARLLPTDHAPEWGAYGPAIARWETITRTTAPAPTETTPKGTQRLSAPFVEWMMGLPAGHVTDTPGLTRNEALKALGNGVVPQQAVAALLEILSWPHVRRALGIAA